MQFFPRILTLCLLTSITPDAIAATTTDNLAVNITITAGCSVTGGTLSFGSQSVLTANVNATASISVTCTNSTGYNVGLAKGTNGTSVTNRKMQRGATTDQIDYTLYSDPGRTTNWGETIGTDTLTGTGNGAAQTLTVYGRVPAQTVGNAGSYTDTVLVTVTY